MCATQRCVGCLVLTHYTVEYTVTMSSAAAVADAFLTSSFKVVPYSCDAIMVSSV